MVPKGWEVSQLKDLIEGSIKNGFSPNPAESDTGYWVLGLGALGEDGIVASEIKPVAPQYKVLNNLLEKDDFLVSRSNTPDKVGRSVRFRGEVANCSYPDLMMRFRIDQRKANMSFIEQQLKSSKVRTYFKNCAAGSSSTMVKINKGILEKTPIPTPPLQEQQKIAQILSTWDKAITTTEQLLANSQQQKKALMQQLLTGKKRLLDNNGVRFNSNWRKLKIQKIFTPSTEKAGNRPYRVYSVTKDGLIDQAEYFKKAVASEDTSTYRVIRKGQFIMSGLNFWMGSADVHSSSEPVKVSPAYKVFDISDSADVSFMKHFVRSTVFLRILVGSSIVGASVVRRNFSPDMFNSWVVELPNIEEQQKIAAVLSNADQEISALQQKLNALKQEKKALMQILLTGKRRVHC
ncbi:restriction endonuclease subunit S [Shewanella sp. GD04112]|uniref:restriction endonuclease subunit S n=1 Tax=Shewanella sp. GD04112 TaxID=2975434 RepID=UPI00244A94A7|nr:restriction endonuclease subunit S [Shewanella sp. GD04112]MDH0450845.1 restriction endonuclease subunit S [Shewanella sp. GD04112]